MTIRVGLLNGTANLNRDHDFGALGYALTKDQPGIVIEGLAVTLNSVAAGRALIITERSAVSPTERFTSHIEVTAPETIDTSGTKKVWLEIKSARVADPSLNVVAAGTDIGQISTGASWPVTPHVKLADITAGVITDARVFNYTLAERIRDQRPNFAIATGSANAYAVALTPAPTALVVGARVSFRANFANTAAATFNLNGLGAISIRKNGGTQDLVSGDIVLNQVVDLEYDGTFWEMQSQSALNTVTSSYDFGDGSDGNVTINAGTTTLTRDMFYNNLTVTSPGILDTNGFKVFVSGTLSGNGTIRRNGNAGGAGGTPTAGTAGAALNTGSLGACGAGVAGATGVSGSSQAGVGTTGYTVSDTFATLSTVGKGGNGGLGGGGVGNNRSGGTGGSCTTSKAYLSTKKISDVLKGFLPNFRVPSACLTLPGGIGGGCGGLDSNGTAGGGGGGGSSGGFIWIQANTVNFSGSIQANGAAGGNAGASTSTSNSGFVTGGSGGGGGGSGGIIYFVCSSFTNTGTISANGGNGGNGSNAASSGGSATANGGDGGKGGEGGYIIVQAVTITIGTTTVTGGTGGTGGTAVNGGSAGATGANGSAGSVVQNLI